MRGKAPRAHYERSKRFVRNQKIIRGIRCALFRNSKEKKKKNHWKKGRGGSKVRTSISQPRSRFRSKRGDSQGRKILGRRERRGFNVSGGVGRLLVHQGGRGEGTFFSPDGRARQSGNLGWPTSITKRESRTQVMGEEGNASADRKRKGKAAINGQKDGISLRKTGGNQRQLRRENDLIKKKNGDKSSPEGKGGTSGRNEPRRNPQKGGNIVTKKKGGRGRGETGGWERVVPRPRIREWRKGFF